MIERLSSLPFFMLNIKKILKMLRAIHLGKMFTRGGYFAAMQTTQPETLKPGDRVRMTEALKAKMRGNCLPGKHVVPLPGYPSLDDSEPDNGCMRCSSDHIEEFGDCIGIVIGPVEPDWPEVDVRWQPSNLRYAYLPEDLEKVK